MVYNSGVKQLFAFIFLAAGFVSAQTPATTARIGNAIEAVRAHGNSEKTVSVAFSAGEHCSTNILAPKSPIALHFHERHEETLFIVSGRAEMRIGEDTITVKPGDVVFLPKRTVHSFKPISDDCVVVSTFSPKFDGVDRVWVE
jgi:mannose-6-phosphate isomerase-like protein (cupin superfamily)